MPVDKNYIDKKGIKPGDRIGIVFKGSGTEKMGYYEGIHGCVLGYHDSSNKDNATHINQSLSEISDVFLLTRVEDL